MKSSSANIILSKFLRKNIVPLFFFQGKDRRNSLERWLRSKEEQLALNDAATTVVSYGKSGRTWLRTMMTYYYQHYYNLGDTALLEFDNLSRLHSEIPKIFFTHDNYIRDFFRCYESKIYYYEKNVVLLARNPIDVAVSQYFHWKHRMNPRKKALNRYPPHQSDVSIEEFVTMESCGLPEIVRFMNLWADELDRISRHLLIRYEDMRADPFEVLSKVIRFVGSPYDAGHARKAVEQSAFARMKSLETSGTVRSGRLSSEPGADPNARKVRKGKVQGYRDYFDPHTTRELEEFCRTQLSDVYGYFAR
jgi:hypothetical protein